MLHSLCLIALASPWPCMPRHIFVTQPSTLRTLHVSRAYSLPCKAIALSITLLLCVKFDNACEHHTLHSCRVRQPTPELSNLKCCESEYGWSWPVPLFPASGQASAEALYNTQVQKREHDFPQGSSK